MAIPTDKPYRDDEDGRAADHPFDAKCNCDRCTLQLRGFFHGRMPYIAPTLGVPMRNGKPCPCIDRDPFGVETFDWNQHEIRLCPKCPNRLCVVFIELHPVARAKPRIEWWLFCRHCRHQWREHDNGTSIVIAPVRLATP